MQVEKPETMSQQNYVYYICKQKVGYSIWSGDSWLSIYENTPSFHN